MRARNLWNLGIKELRGLWREPVMLLLIVYLFYRRLFLLPLIPSLFRK